MKEPKALKEIHDIRKYLSELNEKEIEKRLKDIFENNETKK